MLPLLSSRRAKVTALLVTCLFSGHALVASPITVDGNWSDWGINPNAGVWTPTTGTRIFYENYTGTDGTGFVGPGWGGQYFDVEALYAMRTDNTFYFAVVTGFDPDGVLWQGTPYLAGDIFLDVGTGWNVGVDLQTGGLFTNVSASQSEILSSTPFAITSGNNVGAANLSVPFDGKMLEYWGSSSTSTAHYLFEGSVDLSLVGGTTSATGLHWTMSCGNDLGQGYLPQPVPEPATFCLLGVGAAGAMIARRRSRK